MPELNATFIQRGSKLHTVNVFFSPQRSLNKEMWSEETCYRIKINAVQETNQWKNVKD